MGQKFYTDFIFFFFFLSFPKSKLLDFLRSFKKFFPGWLFLHSVAARPRWSSLSSLGSLRTYERSTCSKSSKVWETCCFKYIYQYLSDSLGRHVSLVIKYSSKMQLIRKHFCLSWKICTTWVNWFQKRNAWVTYNYRKWRETGKKKKLTTETLIRQWSGQRSLKYMVSPRSKHFRLVSEQRKTEERDSQFWPREKWNKSQKWMWGRGRKETLADKPLDFENLRSPVNAEPDWLG